MIFTLLRTSLDYRLPLPHFKYHIAPLSVLFHCLFSSQHQFKVNLISLYSLDSLKTFLRLHAWDPRLSSLRQRSSIKLLTPSSKLAAMERKERPRQCLSPLPSLTLLVHRPTSDSSLPFPSRLFCPRSYSQRLLPHRQARAGIWVSKVGGNEARNT